jgi:hypothetical protein
MKLRSLLLAFPLVLTSCPQSCVPAGNTISWEGRSPVGYVHIPVTDAASTREAQRSLDAGNVVDIGYAGHRHLAGHYSSHGAVFHAGPNLQPGSEVVLDGETFTVTRVVSAQPGDPPNIPAGLTVQYTGCGGVCLVRAQ